VKLAECETHGRDHLANAGAPCFVRCLAETCSTRVLERCLPCGGEGVVIGDERYGLKVVATARPCGRCKGRGWHPHGKPLSSPYPVS
jgi:hypothetical protein